MTHHLKCLVAAIESDEEDDQNLDEDPVLDHVSVNHNGGVNRIRAMPQGQSTGKALVATWSDAGQAHIYDLSAAYDAMLNRAPVATSLLPTKPLLSFKGHREEGYAIDWSPALAGRLATGDCAGAIHVWNPIAAQTSGSAAAGLPSWSVDPKAYSGHRSSVEDLQWSPSEPTVFASCSADKSVRVWDVRGRAGPQISVEDAHTEDVNVISWNRNVAYLLASASDDGSFKVSNFLASLSLLLIVSF